MPDSTIRCPECGRRALPMQSHCRHCEARLPKAAAPPLPSSTVKPDTYGLSADEPAADDRHCRGCGIDLPPEAVLCVQCGYDRRIGNFRTTAVAEDPGQAPIEKKRPRQFDRITVGQLRLVLRGLTLHNARLILGLLGMLVIVGLETYLAVKRVPLKDLPDWVVIGAALGSGMWLLSVALGFLGSMCCLCVPRASGGGLPIRFSLTFDIVAVGLGVAAVIAGWTPLYGLAFGLVSWVLFMAFLVRLARYIERPSEAREARTILIYGLLLIVMPVVLALAATLATEDLPEGNPQAQSIQSLIAVCMPLIGGIFIRIQLQMIQLLESLRDSLRHQVEEAERTFEQFI